MKTHRSKKLLTYVFISFRSVHFPHSYLTRINGELEAQPLARKNIASLEKLVLVQFEQDGESSRRMSPASAHSMINSRVSLFPLIGFDFLPHI